MARRKRSKFLVPLLLVCALIATGGAWYLWSHLGKKAPATQAKTDPYLPKATQGNVTEPSVPNKSPQAIPISSAAQTSQGGAITISAPTQGSTVTSGTTVTGTASVSSRQLFYRLKGVKSGQLALGSIDFNGSTSSSTAYSFELAFTNQVSGGSDQGVLEVFTKSADGSEQSVANVTVNIQG